MSDIMEMLQKFVIPASIAGVGAVVMAVCAARGKRADGEGWLPVIGGLVLAAAMAGGFVYASRSIFGAVPGFKPQIEAEWAVWAGVMGAVIGAAALVLSRVAGSARGVVVGVAVMLGGIVVGALNLHFGLNAASENQFGTGPKWWGMSALVIAAVAVPMGAGVLGAARSGLVGAQGEGARVHGEQARGAWPWLVLAIVCAMGTVPGMFYSRFIKMFEFSASIGGIGVAVSVVVAGAAVVGVIAERRRRAGGKASAVRAAAGDAKGANERQEASTDVRGRAAASRWSAANIGAFVVTAGVLPSAASAWLAAYFYAVAPAISAALGIAAIVSGAVALIVLSNARAWVRVVVPVGVAGVLLVLAAFFARKENHRPDDIYGLREAPAVVTVNVA